VRDAELVHPRKQGPESGVEKLRVGIRSNEVQYVGVVVCLSPDNVFDSEVISFAASPSGEDGDDELFGFKGLFDPLLESVPGVSERFNRRPR
jgi:hypothetical protein